MKKPSCHDELTIRHRFDRLCQMSLKGEAINYYRHMDYRREHEAMFSELSEKELNQLFVMDDGERKDRVILSGIHEYYEPEELVGKTCIAIVNLPPRKMMGIDSEGMLISAVHEEDGHEGLNLLMVDDRIPAGAKLY